MSPFSNNDYEVDYQTAQTICAEQREEALAWAERWRWAFWGALGVAAVSLVGNIGQSYQAKLTPYYIEVSSEGRTRVLGPAPEVYIPRQEAIKEEVRQFVSSLRRVSTDKKLMADDWSEDGLYARVTARGRKLLNTQVAEANPLRRKDIVSVTIRSVLALSEHTVEVRWTEQRYTPQFELLDTQGYRGMVTWTQQRPQTEAEIQHNPLGIFLDTWPLEKE